MPVRAKDLAEMLGVSRSTMSLVINGKPGVSEVKRQEIIQKMREMNCDYLLHGVGRKFSNVGFVVFRRAGDIVNEYPFFSYFLQGMTEKLKEMNYNLTVLYMSATMTQEEQQRIIANAGCVGFIVFAVEMQYEDMQVFKNSRFPFVMLDNSFLVNDVDTVAINNASGIRTAINYLITHGHREIGYIQSRTQINSFKDRFEAYRHMLTANQIPFREEYVAQVGYSETAACQDMETYIRCHNQLPTAFISDNDLIAAGAIRGIQATGLSVPDDISIIGFDDRSICLTIVPSLTTMSVPKDVFGNYCVTLLIDKLKNQRTYALKMEIGTTLIERESVKAI